MFIQVRMQSGKDTFQRGLIVIIGDNASPRRDIAYEYVQNKTSEKNVIRCIDPLATYDDFWKNKLDERLIFDQWDDYIGESFLKMHAHHSEVENVLLIHNYIDTKSDVFNSLVEAAVTRKMLLIITILDRGQNFPKALLDRADSVIYAKVKHF